MEVFESLKLRSTPVCSSIYSLPAYHECKSSHVVKYVGGIGLNLGIPVECHVLSDIDLELGGAISLPGFRILYRSSFKPSFNVSTFIFASYGNLYCKALNGLYDVTRYRISQPMLLLRAIALVIPMVSFSTPSFFHSPSNI